MKAIICGAGPAGLATAIALADNGWDVTILEQTPGPRTQGHLINLFGPGYDTLDNIGILDTINDLSYPITATSYIDATGRTTTRLPHHQIHAAAQHRYTTVTRTDLETALHKRLPDHVDMRYSSRLTNITQDNTHVRVSLANGTTIRSDILIGTDGIHSTVRSLAFGPEEKYVYPHGYHTAAYVFTDTNIRDTIGHRHCVTDTPAKHMSFYTLHDGTITASATHHTTRTTLPGDKRRTLLNTYTDLGWIVPHALHACPPNNHIYYDLVAHVTMPTWNNHRIALAGDACHAVSQLTGHNTSLNLASGHLLGRLLAADSNVPRAMARHEHLWRPTITYYQKNMSQQTRLHVPRTPLHVWARRVAIKATRIPRKSRHRDATHG